MLIAIEIIDEFERECERETGCEKGQGQSEEILSLSLSQDIHECLFLIELLHSHVIGI